ncbi:hypothetical protein Tco_0623607, partial [Tanacetum coccineum]
QFVADSSSTAEPVHVYAGGPPQKSILKGFSKEGIIGTSKDNSSSGNRAGPDFHATLGEAAIKCPI